MKTITTLPHTDDILLRRVKVAYQTILGPQVKEDLNLSIMDDVLRGMTVRLETEIVEHEIDQKTIDINKFHTVEDNKVIGRSPWQRFKERHFYKWSLTRLYNRIFDIKTITVDFSQTIPIATTVDISHINKFPFNEIRYPKELGEAVKITTFNASNGWYVKPLSSKF